MLWWGHHWKCKLAEQVQRSFNLWYKRENWHEQSPWVTWQENTPTQLKFQDGGHFSRWPTQLSDIMVYLVIQAWKLAWAVFVGHMTISHPQLLEMSRWRPFFKMADTLVEQLSDIMVYFVIQACKLVWAVSKGFLTRNTLSHLKFIFSRWPPPGSSKDQFSHRNVLLLFFSLRTIWCHFISYVLDYVKEQLLTHQNAAVLICSS